MRTINFTFALLLLLSIQFLNAQYYEHSPYINLGVAYGKISFYQVENADLYQHTVSKGSLNALISCYLTPNLGIRLTGSMEEVIPVLQTQSNERYVINRQAILAGISYTFAEKDFFSFYSAVQAGIIREQFNLIDREGEHINNIFDFTVLGIHWNRLKPFSVFTELNYGDLSLIRTGISVNW